MKTHDVAQGSAEWLALRLGMPTASEFHRIVTPTGKLSSQARAYAFRLVAEQLLNRTLSSIDNLAWVERGTALEPDAAAAYEFEHDTTVEAVGFCTSDDGRIGASPDGLVGSTGLVEIKCLAPHNHLAMLIDGPGEKYAPQVQGQLLVTEREWVDLYGYSEEMPPARRRTVRDELYIKLLRIALDEFCDMRDELLHAAQSKGVFAARAKAVTAHEQAHGGGGRGRNLYAIPNPFRPDAPRQAPWAAG